MSKRFQDARALVSYARRQWTDLAAAYREEATRGPAVSRELQIGVKNILDNLRSALDYCDLRKIWLLRTFGGGGWQF